MTNTKGENCTLDTLQQGDIIGQYSILSDSTFKFNATATKPSAAFVLKKEFLKDHQHKIDGLAQAMIFANELVLEDGVPI